MSENKAVRSLQGELQTTIEKIEAVHVLYEQIKNDAQAMPSGKQYDLILLAEVFTDFYTCLETGFVRISKFFENNLETSRWHSHLLEKMTISIPAIRERVIGDQSYQILVEFLRFRHFRRYYFDFNYDRDRMEYLGKKFDEVFPAVKKDLQSFVEFLDRLSDR